MKNKLLVSVFLLFVSISSLCFGATKAVIDGDKEADTGDLIVLDASRSTGSAFKWILVNSKKKFAEVDSGRKLFFSSGTPGEYIFVLIVGGSDNNNRLEVDILQHVVTIGKVDPQPTPTPTPTPVPVPPTPVNPSLNPDGFSVLIFYETEDYNLTEDQLQILNSTQIQNYLKSKCVKNDNQPAFRQWDDDLDSNTLPNDLWRKFYDRAKTDSKGKLPWIVISTKTETISVELPKTESETLNLLKKYGG